MDTLELTILNYLRERDVYDKISPYLDETMFSETGQVIYGTLKELIPNTKSGELVKCNDVFLSLSSDSNLGEEKLSEYRNYLKNVRKSKVTNRDILIGICKEFFEKSIWKNSLEKFMPFLTRKGALPLEPIEEAIESTRKIRDSLGDSRGYDFFENLSRSDVKTSPGAIESPIRGVNIFPGELGIWVGPPKRGKTWALVNTGYQALLQGKKVVHFTLEIPADWLALRYDGRILRKPIRELRPEDSLKSIKKVKSFGGRLIIQDRPELTLQDVKEYLKSNKFDLVIIDYPDLMTPPRRYKEKRFELVGIYQGLRALAKEFKIPIWGASQGVAKGYSKSVMTIEDLEESKIGKGGTCALILTINQTQEEKEDMIARIFIAACSRYYHGKQLRRVECDFNSMYMKEINKSEKEE